MRKFYSLKSIAVCTLALLSNVAVAQNLIVTSHGNPVSDGDVIEVPCDIIDYSQPPVLDFCYHYQWNPLLEASTSKGSETLQVTVTNSGNTKGFQICWPNACQSITPGASVSTSGLIDTKPADLQIERELDAYKVEDVPTEGGEITVKLETSSETIEFKVVCLVPEDDAVEENLASINEKTTYFTLEGIQVENPSKGIYIVKKGSKAKLMYKK